MSRRPPRDVRYAPNPTVARVWLRQGKRRIRRLERHASKREIHNAKTE